ncbi:hypothetical protein [Kitasatospora sp. NPDC059817]|uniref:hypothetical protein n=1 Tax=Kitasatospora sp. NPDC059817 TaxID=3346961 RepID=UPI00365BCC1C
MSRRKRTGAAPRQGYTSGNPRRPSPDSLYDTHAVTVDEAAESDSENSAPGEHGSSAEGTGAVETGKANDRIVKKLFDYARFAVEGRLPSNKGRPGPKGLPFVTVLTGLLLAQYERKSANIDDAWEMLFFRLRDPSKDLLDVPRINLVIPEDAPRAEIDRLGNAQYCTSKRVYGSWEPMIKRLDPAPHRRNKCLTLAEAQAILEAWKAPREPGDDPQPRSHRPEPDPRPRQDRLRQRTLRRLARRRCSRRHPRPLAGQAGEQGQGPRLH